VGIPEDKIGSIFDPFHQAQEGQAIDGTGLGLAINQRLISLLGGISFRVESEPGVGSRFRFQIPYQPVVEGGPDKSEPEPRIPDGKQRLAAGMSCSVMVVDRLAENRAVLETLLRYANCEVESLPDPAEAIHRLGEKAFDLLLIDLRQVGPGAAETVSRLRHAVAFGSPKAVAVSANVLEDTEQRARQAGFDAFLAKPFTDQQLFGLIEQLLDIQFETVPEQQQIPFDLQPKWPSELAIDTAKKIHAAIDLGDVASLFQLAEDLAENPDAPHADAENLALMARMFDFDGLRRLSERMLETA
jgi:polar amino acid transport system substrate-binding protein/two-component system sensor histidine kinase EvgS